MNYYNKFCIYTTGICDTNQYDKLFKYWQDSLCDHICSMIPSRFTSIEIIHSDIIYKNFELINELKIYNRISKHIIQKEELDFDKISKTQSYIIIDFAHIFYYTNIPIKITPYGSSRVYIGGHYNEPLGEPINLNIVYLGYVGEQQFITESQINNRIICESEFFKINNDNTIITFYTQLLNENRFSKLIGYELISPINRITNIIQINRIKIGKIFKIKYGNYNLFDQYFSYPNLLYPTQIYKFIVNYIMNYIITEPEILDLIETKILKEFDIL